MPSILTKLIPRHDLCLSYNCYEVGHTWTPYCSRAATDLGLSAFLSALKMYTSLYLLTQVLTGKYERKDFENTMKSILRSSGFIGFQTFATMSMFCFTSNRLGKLYLFLIGHFPSMIAGYLAIHLEKKSRRGPLAIYVANIATETVVNFAIGNGMMKPIKNFEVCTFIFSSAIFMYISKKNGFSNDLLSVAMKFLIGRNEASPRRQLYLPIGVEQVPPAIENTHSKWKLTNLFNVFLSPFTKHDTCSHMNESCFGYILSGFVKPTAATWLGYGLFQCLKNQATVMKNPSTLYDIFTRSKTRNIALFVGSYAAIYRGVNCILRHVTNQERPINGAIGGFFAGFSMFFHRDHTVAQYFFWRIVELLYSDAARAKRVKYVNFTICITYALSCAQLFFVAAICPEYLRSSYVKFLDRITDNALCYLNRNIIEQYGQESLKGYKIIEPDFDEKFVSNKFQESVLNWMI